MIDDRIRSQRESRLWGLAALVVSLVVGIAVAQFERIALAEAAGSSAGAIVFTGWLYWPERQQRWFGYYMAAITIIHVVAVVAMPWPVHHDMNKGDMLIWFPDFILTMVIGGLVMRLNRNGGETPSKF